MVLTTLIQILVGLLTPFLLARYIHRRWGVRRMLLLPGAIAGLAGLLIGGLAQGGVIIGLASIPQALSLPVLAGAIGIIAGLLAAGLITAAQIWLAPGVRTFPQVLMVWAGFGGAEMVMRAGLAALVLVANLQLDWFPPPADSLTPDEWAAQTANLEAYFASPPIQPLLEAMGALGKIAQGLAITVLVGTMFLSGQVGWFFGGLFWAAVGAAGAQIFGRGGVLPGAVWWAAVGAVSIAVIARRARQHWPVGGREPAR